jgi:hypothetical protein
MFVTMTVRLNVVDDEPVLDKGQKEKKPLCTALPFDVGAISALIHKGLRFRSCDDVWVTVDKLNGRPYPKVEGKDYGWESLHGKTFFLTDSAVVNFRPKKD